MTSWWSMTSATDSASMYVRSLATCRMAPTSPVRSGLVGGPHDELQVAVAVLLGGDVVEGDGDAAVVDGDVAVASQDGDVVADARGSRRRPSSMSSNPHSPWRST